MVGQDIEWLGKRYGLYFSLIELMFPLLVMYYRTTSDVKPGDLNQVMSEPVYIMLLQLLPLFVGVLGLILVVGAKRMPGRAWLILALVLLWISVGFNSFLTLSYLDIPGKFLVYWAVISQMLTYPGNMGLLVFLFINWAQPRFKPDMNAFMFFFTGRASRSIYAFLMVILIVLDLGLMGFATNLDGNHSRGLLVFVWTITVILMMFASWVSLVVSVQRWHDCGRSGWMSLLYLISLIGPIGVMGYLMFARGAEGENRYGESPLQKIIA